jgi:mutual gliding-motility protein MglA
VALIDIQEQTIVAKIVYVGPAASGKTTNLHALYDLLPSEQRSGLASFESEDGATIFFDFVPVDTADVGGYRVTFRVFTVSGQDGRTDARRAVLPGVDGVVFVADATRGREADNAASWEEVRSLLADLDPSGARTIPVVVQYNKLDRPELAEPDDLRRELQGAEDAPAFYASAIEGRGVAETFTELARLVIHNL